MHGNGIPAECIYDQDVKLVAPAVRELLLQCNTSITSCNLDAGWRVFHKGEKRIGALGDTDDLWIDFIEPNQISFLAVGGKRAGTHTDYSKAQRNFQEPHRIVL